MYDSFLGVIQALGFKFAPENWAYCNGTLVAINQQSALFALLGCNYGGDCRSVFAYPDLRGRTPIGQFKGPGGSDWRIGERTGLEYDALGMAELPSHTHTHTYAGGGGSAFEVTIDVATDLATVQIPSDGDYIGIRSDGFGTTATGNLYVPGDSVTGSAAIGGVTTAMGGDAGFDNNFFAILPSGSSSAIALVEPSLVVNYCICIDGIFPARS